MFKSALKFQCHPSVNRLNALSVNLAVFPHDIGPIALPIVARPGIVTIISKHKSPIKWLLQI